MKNIFLKVASISLMTTFSLSCMEEPQAIPQWDGKHYRQHSVAQWCAAMRRLPQLELTKFSRILDIGCAAGDITAAIADKAPQAQVLGIDISANMIAAANNLMGPRSLCERPNLKFRVQDGQQLNFNDEFDGAVSFLTLHWMENKAAFFQGLFKSLKPNGEFLITVGTKNAEMEAIKRKFFGALLQDPKLQFLMKTTMVTANNAMSKEELLKMARDAGFKDVQIEEHIESHDFSSKEELKQFFATFAGGYKDIAAMPQEERESFIAKAADEWPKVMENGAIRYMWANLVAKGKKPSN